MTNKEITAFDRRLGRRLRMARIMKGFTQEDMARLAGVSFQQIQKNENGTNRITADRLYRISQGLAVPITFFFERSAPVDSAEPVSDDALRLAGRIEALPSKLIRYDLSSLVQSINRAWEKRDRE